MKKIMSRSVVIILIAVTLASPALSQQLALNANKEKLFATPEGKEQSRKINYINDVNAKVLKSFYRSYGERPDAKWFKTDNGFVVFFKNNNMNTNVYYLENGVVQYAINYYSEEQLPRSVRHTVKSNFYDYSIVQVSEVQKDGSTCFFIKIEDAVFIKIIRVIGEEWAIVEELVKQ